MALSRDQRRVAQQFARAIHDVGGVTPRLAEALFEAGLQESGLRNLNYGDRDSLGALQERTSIYGRSHALNPYQSAVRFLRDGKKIQAQGYKGSSGLLAQAIQRSAFPNAYETHNNEAESLIRQFVSGSPSGGGSGQQTQTGGPTSAAGSSFGIQPGPDTTALLAQLIGEKQTVKPQASGIQAPAYAAHATLPGGYQGIQSSGGPGPKQDTQGLLEALSGLGATTPGVSAPSLAGDAQNGPGLLSGSSKRAGRPKPGLGHASSMVNQLIKGAGLPITARDEPGHAVGGDHDPSTPHATAYDVGGSDSQRKALWSQLMGELGVRGARFGGADVNVTVGGVRYQIISRPHGTGPHLHIGLRKTGR